MMLSCRSSRRRLSGKSKKSIEVHCEEEKGVEKPAHSGRKRRLDGEEEVIRDGEKGRGESDGFRVEAVVSDFRGSVAPLQ